MRKKIKFTHPGILLKENMQEMQLSAYRVSKETGIHAVNLGKILSGKRAITSDTGLRLAKFFNVSENFFINMQTRYDIELAKHENARDYKKIRPYQELDLAKAS